VIYLSGAVQPSLRHPRIGWMVTPEMGNVLPDHGWWAADNGCFTNPTGFSWAKYEAWLTVRLSQAADRFLFATAPDVPFDGDGTLARFDEYITRMAATAPRIAMVTQDGMHSEDLRWDDFDALFVGGTTEWKTGQESAAICLEAGRRGKWVHMGRVNSMRRIRAAQSMGCDSVDGTYLKYGPDVNTPRLLRWMAEVERQPPLRWNGGK